MKILVTGAQGMLGQDLCPVLEDEGYDVIETDVDNLDILNENLLESFFKENTPDIVIHCAAYTNVDNAEKEPDKAKNINVKGTQNIAKIASKYNSLMIYISTDYVFDGEKKSPYEPDDSPSPLNVYGRTKLEGEICVKQHCQKYYIVRTSWLYGVHGKNFVEKIIELSIRDEIKVVDDQIGSPTWTVVLSNGIMELIKDNMPYGTYHICGKGTTSWFGFAKMILEMKDYKGKLLPCKSSEYHSAAVRPSYSVMKSSIMTPKWDISLRDYMYLRPEEG